MKKGLFVFLIAFGFVLSSFFAFSKKEKTENFYVDMRGWSEFFEYYPKSQMLKNENVNFKVLNKTKNSFLVKNEDAVDIYYKLHFADDEYELLSKSYMQNEKNKKIAVLTFSMGSDESRWKAFYDTMEKNFLTKHSKEYFVFTDNNNLKVQSNVLKIAQYDGKEESLNLKKFDSFDRLKNILKSFDYIYFADLSFLPKHNINEEVIPTKEQEVVMMMHPCFYDWKEEEFPFEKNNLSASYIPQEERKFYITNAFFGGTTHAFFKLGNSIKKWVDSDSKNAFVPKLKDESFLNRYLHLKIKESEKPMIVMSDSIAFNQSCKIVKEESVDQNLIYIYRDGKKKSYNYDPETRTLNGEDDSFVASKKTKSTITILTKEGTIVYHRVYYSQNEYEPLTESKITDSSPKKIAVITFAMGDDVDQWNGFYQSSKKNFLPKHHKKYFVFTDQNNLKINHKEGKKIFVKEKDFDLKKFHLLKNIKNELDSFDYVYLMDISLDVVTAINEEVLPTKEQALVYAIHPWHYRWSIEEIPYERNSASKAYIKKGEGKFYVQSVFYGGTKDAFIKLSQTIQSWVDEDLKEKATPKWKDEGYLNKYLFNMKNNEKNPLILTPNYIYPKGVCGPAGEFESDKKMILKSK